MAGDGENRRVWVGPVAEDAAAEFEVDSEELREQRRKDREVSPFDAIEGGVIAPPPGLLVERLCDVCNKNPMIGVAAIPGMPISVAYCHECLRANAHPWGILVAHTSMLIERPGQRFDGLADWYQEMVGDTCVHLGKSMDQFCAEVDRELVEDAEYWQHLATRLVTAVRDGVDADLPDLLEEFDQAEAIMRRSGEPPEGVNGG